MSLERPTRLKLRGFRSWLVTLHKDLFSIHANVPYFSSPAELSTLEKMVLALEDRRFFQHAGTDWFSVVREILRAGTFQRYGGASTIDMQFVRTITNKRKKTLGRKVHEIVLARIIQYRYSKIRILRGYISCAFFGSHLYGSESASKAIFGKTSGDLNIDEAAFVASMLVYPRPLKPTPQWDKRVRRRANYGKIIYIRNKKKLDQLKVSEKHYIP